MGKIKVEFTKAQFTATIDIVDTLSAMCGAGSDFTEEVNRNIRLFDRMMKANGYKRKLS